jgi:hypothetical protein
VASLLFLGTACGLVGNFQAIHFYPVGAQASTAALTGTIYNLSGKIKLTSAGGEAYAGELAMVGRPTDPTDAQYTQELAFPKAWDAVYGDHFHSKTVLGAKLLSRGQLVSPSGVTLYVEIVRLHSNSDARIGVAVDGKQQVYKVTF